MDNRRRLLNYILRYKGRLLLAGLCALLISGCMLVRTELLAWFVSLAGNGEVTDISVVSYGLARGWFTAEHARPALVIIVAVLNVLVSVPNSVLGYLNSYLVSSVTYRIGTDVRSEMYSHLQTLPLSFFHRSRIGDIMSRMSNDVGLIQQSSNVVMQAIDGPVMIIAGLTRMFVLNWKLTTLTLIFVPLMGIAIDRITKKIRQLTNATQMRLADVSSAIEESIHGVRIIRSFGTEDQEIKRFNRVNTSSLYAALRYCRRNALVVPGIDLMGAVTVSFILLIGGTMLVRDEIDFPVLMQLGYLAFIVAASAKQFGKLNVTYQQVLAGADRIFQLMDTKSDLKEDPDGAVLNDVQGRVEFRNVHFEYNPGEIVLENLSFTMEPGQVVAIVGPSGAGKSTIADLIPRFYDVTGGQILVEGHDVRNIKTFSLREHIAMVPQETILFSGTIAENIAYGKPGAPLEEIIEVARAANAHDFIQQCPASYDTVLGEGGVGLSGGQRQRISIARALLRNPRILILDEATSSLDAASEGIVQEALDRLMKGRSTLVIAHRLSTVKNADTIIVMDKGRVFESGSFDALIKTGGLFAQLYRTQFRSEQPEEVS